MKLIKDKKEIQKTITTEDGRLVVCLDNKQLKMGCFVCDE